MLCCPMLRLDELTSFYFDRWSHASVMQAKPWCQRISIVTAFKHDSRRRCQPRQLLDDHRRGACDSLRANKSGIVITHVNPFSRLEMLLIHLSPVIAPISSGTNKHPAPSGLREKTRSEPRVRCAHSNAFCREESYSARPRRGSFQQ